MSDAETRVVEGVWTVGLVVAYLALPLLLLVLRRILTAAGKIRDYLAGTRAHSRLLPAHLAALAALEQTTVLLGGARTVGGAIADGAEALVGVLLARAGGKRP